MNNLKKNIIYQYMLVSTILVIASIYLWWGYESIIPWISVNIYGGELTSELLFGGLAWIIEIVLFTVCAYWFHSKVSKYIEQETNKQIKKQNQLFANIAHDLKSPMTVVIGLSRALEEDVITEDQKKQVAHTITEKSKHMDKIINLMFQYAKMDIASYKLHKSEVDVVRLVKEFTAQRYHEFENKKMDLDIVLPDNQVIAWIDRLEFSRAVDNLITNSIRHNQPGTRIQIGLEDIDGNIKIWVADSGDKIPKEIQTTIFDPFICGDKSRNTEGGSGLGLAITKKIVKKHNGKISIVENINGYTKAFVIKIVKN
ncbi:sensor histidine kinase [Clostridium tagluense]|uniref:sensor histidine kinase n=1 Tax=Clostridium tagluense TaxID=360422 RepID=UPI001CF264FB|nr:HAMP domain-containing sensor histidine kinase [Clostridium tagluense]MCB2300817.1 HAMP domain-containing histidine kinase [Clostridium tagluense]